MSNNAPFYQTPASSSSVAGSVAGENDEWPVPQDAVEATAIADGELQPLFAQLSIMSGELKKPSTETEVADAWQDVFRFLPPEARRSLLLESPVRSLSQLSPETKQALLGTPKVRTSDDMPGPVLFGAGPGGSPDPPSEQQPVPAFPREPMTVYQGLGSVPPEILMVLHAYIPPLDELLLCHTHPSIFNNDRFSFYRVDAEYQVEWQQFNPRCEDERVPLLYHAISNDAPMSVITDILDSWQANGMDYDMAWAAGRVRTPPIMRPILFATGSGRVDVIQELRQRGASEQDLEHQVRLRAHSAQARARFTDETWWRMETLAIELCNRDVPTGAMRQLWLDACVCAGWKQLFRLFLELALGIAPLRASIRARASWWITGAGRVRRDSKAMFDFLFDRIGAQVMPPIEAQRGDDTFDDWLSSLIVGGANQPKRPLNAAHLLDRMRRQNSFHLLSLATTVPRYILECAADDACLPLTRALHDGLVDLTANYSYTFLTQAFGHDYTPARHPDILRAYMLHVALTSPQGAPQTVRWLACQGLVDLHLNMWELNRPHALQGLASSASAAVLQVNFDAILTRMPDPNAVVDEQVFPVRPVDLIHEHAATFVEFVARAPAHSDAGVGVDLTLASVGTKNAARERRELRESGMEIATMGRSLSQLMVEASISYEVRRRILDWCIVMGTNDVPAVIRDV
ncbi:hypothetical protein PG997_001903 [Apiospora hydei]|uniref:Uncharacterized protein n=1 Tax=Apiospora hydei TaxID=1337664 RepID=A0ABR1X7W4_9PEZI